MRIVSVAGRFETRSLPLRAARGEILDGDLRLRWRPGQAAALDAPTVAGGREVGNVTVERQGSDGAWRDAVHDVPFAFAAFNPGAPIHHEE